MIRVPMLPELPALVRCADMSLHSDLSVLRALNVCGGGEGGLTHRVMLMVDLGDPQEGFGDIEELAAAAETVEKELSSLEPVGIGTNLSSSRNVRLRFTHAEEAMG